MRYDMLLSVIVPVYNVEDTLERCIDSIESQDLPHDSYEVIIVNDGSTDNSLEVARRMAGTYNNVAVISKENGGLSSTRNAGLDAAKGKYVMFVDSDDYIYPDSLSALVSECESDNLDVAHFFLNVETLDGQCKRHVPTNIKFGKTYTGEELLASGNVIGSACNNIFRSSLFSEHSLRFVEGITHEDTELTTRLFCYVHHMRFVDMDVYHYSYNSKSLSRDVDLAKVRRYLYDSATVTALSMAFAKTQADISSGCKDIILRYNNTGLACMLLNFILNTPYPVSLVSGFLEQAKSKGIYPMHGLFLNRRTKWLGYLFNCKSLFMAAYRIKYLAKHVSHYAVISKKDRR